MAKWFDGLDKLVKIILLIPIWGWIIAGLYRIFTYVDNKKNPVTLVMGILCIIPIVGFIFSIIDIVTVATENKIKILCEQLAIKI